MNLQTFSEKFLTFFIHFYSRLQLPSTYPVLIQVVSVYFVDIERSVGIIVPTATIIDNIVDSAYLVLSGDAKTHRIVLPILRRREVDRTKHRNVESARSAKTIYAQSVVTAILRSPLTMIDDSRRQSLHLEVGHSIGTDNHGAVLGIESVHELLHRVLIIINIVRIQLDGEFTTLRMVQGGVPVASDGVIALVLRDIHELRVIDELLDDINGSVSGVVVNHDHVIFESGLLIQRGSQSVAYRAHPVLARDDDRGLIFKGIIRELDMLEFRFQIATDILKMLCTSLFHLNLDSTVLRIHIVEEFLAGLAGVGLDLVVKIFIDVDKASPLGDF